MSSALRTVLVLTADTSFAGHIKRTLKEHGYDGLVSESLTAALQVAESASPIVLILDRRVVSVKQVRQTATFSKVLCLSVEPPTMLDPEDHCAQDLDDGADAYVCGTAPRQIVALVRALVRRSQFAMKRRCTVGGVEMDFDRYEVRVNGRAVDLTRKQYQILEMLFLHPAKIVSREELITTIWGENTAMDEHTITVHIHAIRKKIQPDAKSPQLLQTVQGIGYRLKR